MLLKKVFWVAVGAAGALEIDRWWSRQRNRLRPHALTGALLDRVNRGLEDRNADGFARTPAETKAPAGD